ncbi:PP2C family protein-serine/threonine phosphatase [Microcoleus anatoxicus]|uniref:PP2C family protein-serine/threonine phosphatase n=1 Tax=Microcoleus anatoxicus TaxID=2705319 RepID=UPI0030C9752B
MTNTLVIQEKTQFSIDNFKLEVLSYLGQLRAGIHYFKVKIQADDDTAKTNNFGLLRVGASEGALKQEVELREVLSGYKMIGELLAKTTKDSVKVDWRSVEHPQPQKPEKPEINTNFEQLESLANSAEPIFNEAEQNDEKSVVAPEDATDETNPKLTDGGAEIGGVDDSSLPPADSLKNLVVEPLDPSTTLPSTTLPSTTLPSTTLPSTTLRERGELSGNPVSVVETPQSCTADATNGESEYLEEQSYPEEEMCADEGDRKLLLLTYLPEDNTTLQSWLGEDNSLESCLSITSQVCQFFRYIHKHGWCFVQILPQFIELGTPIKFFDLTGAYPLNEKLRSGLSENYAAPELAYGSHPIQEAMSSYTVGALLYHAIHKQPLSSTSQIDLKINPIPRIYQLLKIALSPLPEERFPLSQLLSLLVETRQSLQGTKIDWNVASRSTTGLSTSRLQNEDSYGIRQMQLSNSETLILGVVADGMGGMSQGEVASKLAVQTALEEPIPAEFNTIEQKAAWLVSLVQKANESVATQVRDGGTTLSITLAVGRDLAIAHVGDSRIYLLRQGEMRQLSEDHSLVAMLVASGQISQAESLDHPDRNVLTKSIGSKRRLSDGYVQQLSRSDQNLSLALENGDILLLCSDGVWDLVSNAEIAQFFTHNKTLQTAVDEVINCVLQRGASDNATLLALQLSSHPDNRY